MKEINTILNEIKLIKQSINTIERNGLTLGDWMPKKAVMRYFDYGETQMRTLEKEYKLETSKIGNRKFYKRKSILEILDNHKNNLL